MDRLIGKIPMIIRGATQYNDKVEIIFSDLTSFVMRHVQDCCENVQIEEIIGDIKDLIGRPLMIAEEAVSVAGEQDYGSGTATWYKFVTTEGAVTFRWLGESNGYYSERVDLEFYQKFNIDTLTEDERVEWDRVAEIML